jgi:RNA-directed DNA polymerase
LYKVLNISENNPKKDRYRICNTADFRSIVRGNKLINRNIENRGIPQGSPISAFLSNIYMFEFDKIVSALVTEQGGIYYRYCDDMLFIVPTEFAKHLSGFVRAAINKLKIDINPKKTEIRDFTYEAHKFFSIKPLQYLGFLYDGEKILIRSAALAKYSERMRRGIRLAKKTKIKGNRIKIAKGQKPTKLYKKKIYERYSHLGGRNFIRYGLKAAKLMNSIAIKKQLRPLWRRLKEEIEK